MNMKQATEMVLEAERLGLKIGCCSCRPVAWPLNQKAREIVQEGKLGRIYLVDWIDREERGRRGLDGFSKGVWWSLDRSKAGGGLLMDLTPYDVSIWRKVFNPSRITILNAIIERIHVPAQIPEGVTHDVESHVSATLQFDLKDGTHFVMRFERSDSNHGPAFHQHFIHGLDGGLTWDLMGYGDRTLFHFSSKRDGEPQCIQIEEPAPPVPESYVLHPLPQFALHVEGKASEALTGTDSLKQFSVIQAIYQCAESNKPITVQL
jgi:predicted dehydrogenase